MENSKKINFFAIPVFSFVPPKYKQLVKESAGKIFGALYVSFIILYVLLAVFTMGDIDEVGTILHDELPDFSYVNDSLYCPEPVYIDQDGVFFVVDTSVEIFSEDDLRTMMRQSDQFVQNAMALGEKGMAIYSSSGIQSIKYSDFNTGNGQSLTLTKDTLLDTVMPIIKSVVFIALLIAPIFVVGWLYLLSLALQLFTVIFAAIMKRDIDSVSRYRLTVLARFATMVITFVISNVWGFSDFWVSLLITAVIILFAVKFMKDDEETPAEYIPVESQNFEPVQEAYVVNNSNEPKAVDFFSTPVEESAENSDDNAVEDNQ